MSVLRAAVDVSPVSENSAATVVTESAVESTAKGKPHRKPWRKHAMHWIRRGHLYMGLFLFPWAILYGVTAFLFNHPTIFSDQPTASFGRDATKGTPLESLPKPSELAAEVVAKLNDSQKPTTPYVLAGEAKYARDFASASVKAEGQTISIFVDLKSGGGMIRATPIREKVTEKAPFAVGSAPSGRPTRTPNGIAPRSVVSDAIKLEVPLVDRIKETVPVILERSGFATGEVSVTSVPDVVFPIEADGQIWTATYNPVNGGVSGTSGKPESEMSWRRFLLRLHLAHGYPGEVNSKWMWALIVDAMAFTMCFWGLSGLVMWWQIKATRLAGAIVLVVSAIAATALGIGMHWAFTS